VPSPPARRRQPLSTYRLQLRPGFGFDQAAALAGYLAELGVSHLYTSPCLQAAPGSTHGYDVVDPTRANVELGGAEGHRRLSEALARAGLGQVLDVVPNHMAISGPENAWWWDVLENGPASVYASYFDVEWDPPEAKLHNTVLLPILNDHYGRALEAGQIQLSRHGGSFVVGYFDRALPVAPRSLDDLLSRASVALRAASPDNALVSDELESVAVALGNLPASWVTDRDSQRARHRDKEVLRARLADLFRHNPSVAAVVDREVAAIGGDPERLDALLERQNYRLAHWRTASQELDYRRFFDIDTLIGLRVEDEVVFADTHALVLSWVGAGVVDGLRIDHIDGLWDPGAYLRRLESATGGAWVVVEKVLEPGERLREGWPVAGTTGYDFAARVNGLFFDPAGEAPLSQLWAEISGEREGFAEVAHHAKHAVMASALSTELARLTALAVRVCTRHRRYRDYTRADLSEALEELIACLEVYRTYVGPQGRAHPDDGARVSAAIAEAARRRGDLDTDLLDFLRAVLIAGPLLDEPAEVELRLRFQQVSGSVMAKGVEDTALYRYHRLIAQNDVGTDPTRWATTVGAFHAASASAQQDWPTTMVTTSTHDTKLSEDVRARLAVLSEVPEAWAAAVVAWRAANDHLRRGDMPDAPTEYLLYQILVGAWPIDADRAASYMAKATKEAKLHTSWTDPVPAYDEALEAFVRSALAEEAFVNDLVCFVEDRLLGPGWVTSLAQALLKLTVPGVPDTYQGCELWDLSLVDPDNRRPVDFGLRQRLLGELGSLSPEAWWDRAAEGLPKLAVTHGALALRRAHPDWFGPGGDYRPLGVSGEQAHHLVAFARADRAVTVVPRLVSALASQAQLPDLVGAVSRSLTGASVALPPGRWKNVLTGDGLDGGEVDAGGVLSRFPVALLAREA
jgi:(1->4)-alpha-D-glucan 1-alpha-D-glucosylmutase